MKSVAVLLSGRGSNFLALHDAIGDGRVAGRIVAVVADVADAPGLQRAAERGCFSLALPRPVGGSRRNHERALAAVLRERGAEVICLAGYMRVLSPEFLAEMGLPVLNVHPSLLPAFAGLHPQRQALAHGVKVSGCTVHYVDASLDDGPIVAQRAVPVLEDDDEESLSARILAEEHRVYPQALALLCAGRLRLEGRRVRVLEAPPPGSSPDTAAAAE